MKSEAAPASTGKGTRLRELTASLRELEARLREGGGADKIERQHKQGKLTARERIDLLLDSGSYAQEVGLLVAYDQYEGAAPAAGVVTVVGRVGGREVVIVANDATVKAGSWWPETIKKILRAQEIAMRCRIPIVYLVDSADVILMVEGTSFMGLGGPNLVKGATGQVVDAEVLGGARTHTEISAVAHFMVPDDAACCAKIRDLVERLPRHHDRAAS